MAAKNKWGWRNHLTEEERAIIEAGDAAKAEWQRLNVMRAGIINRAIGYVLEGVEPLPFRPYKGALGLFEVEGGGNG